MKSFKLGVDRFLLALFLGFLLAALAVIWDSQTIDRTQTPRLFALYLFLGVVWLFTTLPQVRACLAWNALKSPLVYSYLAYLVSVWASLFVAFNISAGFMDAFKTLASFLVLCSAVVKAAGLPPNSTEHLGHRMASRQTYHVVRMGWVGINGGQ